MYGFLVVLLVLDGAVLTVAILLQAGKGGGLAAMGGGAAATEGILGGRQAATVLTRGTWTAGTIFLVLALVLAIISSRAQQPQSILRQETPPAATTPEPVLPGVPEGTPVEGTPTEPAAPGTPAAPPVPSAGDAGGGAGGAGAGDPPGA